MAAHDVILVTGATGNIGTALVHLLASDASQPLVRAATRNINGDAATMLRAFNPQTIQPTAFNERDPESLRAAFAGVTKLCVIAPFGDNMPAWHEAVLAAAEAAGSVEYVVKVSVTGARSPDSDPAPGRIPLAHWQGEEAIRKRGFAATMIRPTIFMQHFLTMSALFQAGHDRFYLPTGSGPIAFLDCRDIATAAAALLTATPDIRRPYDGQSFELTGPAAITAAEIAAILSAVTSKPITHVDGMVAFEQHCQELGVPDGIKYVYAEAADGWFSQVEAATFKSLTGHLPTSFAKFAFDHATFFNPPTVG